MTRYGPYQPWHSGLKNEVLHLHCTAKGFNVGSGGRVAQFIVAIAHQKGVVLCEHYEGKINGDMFSDFIKTHFQSMQDSKRQKVSSRWMSCTKQ